MEKDITGPRGGGRGGLARYTASPQVEDLAGDSTGEQQLHMAGVLGFETLYIFFKSIIMWHTPN